MTGSAKAPRVQATGLGHGHGGLQLFQGLSFAFGPGLHLVCGGEGRGKTSLLGLLAGEQAPRSGTLQVQARGCSFARMARPELDDTEALAWLKAQRQQSPDWQGEAAEALIDAFELGPHLGKRLHMLSTGSRRKLGWVLALAGGAELALFDQPFAALDARSCRALADALRAEAAQGRRMLVLADHEPPAWLDGAPWGRVINLGQ